MPIRLILFSVGVIAVSLFPRLPPFELSWLMPASSLLLFFNRRAMNLIALLLGLSWGIFTGHQLVAMQLDHSLVSKTLNVVGTITDLPEKHDQRLRFALTVRAVKNTRGESLDLNDFPKKIQLGWYQNYGKHSAASLPDLVVGQVWSLKVRLKRPRGFANPAGFDYHAWLLRHGIGATGYVVQGNANTLITVQTDAKHSGHDVIRSEWLSRDDWIDRRRQLLQQWILSRSDSTERGILIALLIGDSAEVEKEQWDRMQKTGTSHLIAISGLHVGFLALFGFYAGLALGKCVQLVWRNCPAMVVAWIAAIICASFYSALAGFNIPTLRTLIMLAMFYVACLWRRNLRIFDIFCYALALVVIIDPLAAYDMGFWLSFGAVALLLFYFSGRLVEKNGVGHWQGFSFRDVTLSFIRSQWAMFVGLLIPLSLLVSSVSLVAPVTNAIAIPLITFFVVPLLLVGAALQNLSPAWADPFLALAGGAMEWLKLFLQFVLSSAGDLASPVVAFHPSVAALVGLSCLLLLLPRGLIPRAMGWYGLAIGIALGYVIPRVDQPKLEVTIMDVGQGTAVVIRAGGKTLVYDTGPKYTKDFAAGGAILAPYLFSQGVSNVEALVVSHNDRDHAGGLHSFLEKVDATSVLLGDSKTVLPATASSPSVGCHGHKPWAWGEVHFEFLTTNLTSRTSDNNRSCVLLVRYHDQHLLFPGDIEAHVENQLIRSDKLPADLTLVVAAHHGSRTSSGARFVSYARPDYVVYSAGYRSHHGHPHPQVRRRYQAVGSHEFNTAISGAVRFEWFDKGPPIVTEQRKRKPRYWFQ